MNFSIRQVQVFVAVMDGASFTSAARSLHMTQSAVSKQVAELERQLGFRLFERTTRSVVATEAAREFHGFALELMATVKTATRSVIELTQMERGSVSLAASPLMIYGLLAEAVAGFAREHPGIAFELHELTTDETVDAVRTGAVDIGLCALDSEVKGVDARIVHRDCMQVVVPQGHVLTRKASLDWTEVAELEHVSLRHLYSVRRTLDALIRSHGGGLPSRIEAGTLTAVLGLVRAGAGVAVLPGYAAKVAEQWGMHGIPIRDIDAHSHRISLLRRQGAQLSIAARTFATVLTRHLTGEAGGEEAGAD
ncbi:LysR family transcriptional regulator [Verticiella sediminum]|uniref:LysR family transcriptional regulator n=1 Tax=Verticiella sediminum TaxID=1247510 RepID=A0A556AB74_9BURK|nr:LysR family transcriptional regulator [Verticiella sediminum]TSH90121.1 LysR family transcriptional regulator [Verticiella sediminum]